jgi:thiol-disulfide isomerase/thioredoxin
MKITPPLLKMNRIAFSIVFTVFSVFGLQAQNVPVIDLNQLDARLENGADTTFVVNFWATWCGPCVKELPFFETLESNNTAEKLKVLLVTLDFVENLEPKVIPFLEQKAIKSEVLLLDESNPNEWIPRVSDKWSGAIPATIFVNTQKKTRHFHEGSFKEGELETKLKELGL